MDLTTDILKDADMADEKKERRKAYCKAYREANKERRNAWYQANKVRVVKAARELRQFLRQERLANEHKVQA